MTCGQCGTNLACRMKDYGGNFAPTLQWQNFDGSAHYKTSDGKNYTCHIPEGEVHPGAEFPTPSSTTPGDPPRNTLFSIDLTLKEKIESCDLRLEKIEEMIQAIFRYTVDTQLREK